MAIGGILGVRIDQHSALVHLRKKAAAKGDDQNPVRKDFCTV